MLNCPLTSSPTMRIDPSKAVSFFLNTLDRSSPEQLIPSFLKHDSRLNKLNIFGHDIKLTADREVFIIGSGKASVVMAEAASRILDGKLSGGVVITDSVRKNILPKNIEVLSASHPVPNEKSIHAANRLVDFLESIPKHSIVLNLLSGGTSSLLCKPVSSVPFKDVVDLYKILMKSGLNIHEMNLVRKSVSDIKAGQLLQHIKGSQLFDLIISDVPNDDIKDIGSGPSIAQSFRYSEVISLLKKNELWQIIPDSVKSFLLISTKENDRFETKDIPNHQSQIILSSNKAATIAKEQMEKEGVQTIKDEKPWAGSIDDFEKHILSKIPSDFNQLNTPTAYIFFGECSVKVKGDGKGGRNQELALRMAKHLANYDRNIIFLSAGTDGIDGPTDAAGAVVHQKSLEEARQLGLDADDYLHRNDSYSFFDKLGSHIKTGPTGNNVMDLQFLIID